MAEIVRDTVLEQRMLEAVIADRNDQPRNRQLQVGPSSVGGCRELLRASLFEPDTTSEPETNWAAAAHVGTVMGADLERIFGQRLGALEQQRVTATLTQLGIQISGAIDLMFVAENTISDLKSNADIGGVLYDLKKNADIIETLLEIWRDGDLFRRNIETPNGAYELTQSVLSTFSKLHYYVQIAIYVTGAVQSGVLDPGAEGRLVFYDRSGSYQDFVALVLDAEQIAMFFDIGQHRVMQVAETQTAYEATGGNPAVIAHLRDMVPSYCFSAKVMCPRRMHCWGGSEWTDDNRLDGAELAASAERYKEGRRLENVGKAMKSAARDELKGISGVFPNGTQVTWTRGGSTINVVDTKTPEEQPKPRAGEQVAAAVAARAIEIPTDVGITGDGDVVDLDVAATAAQPDRSERMERIRATQRAVAANKHARGRVANEVRERFEADERQKYGGLEFHSWLKGNIDPIKHSEMKHRRDGELLMAQRAALHQAGMRETEF